MTRRIIIECPNCHVSTRLDDSPPSALWNSRPIVSGDGVMIKLEKRVYDVLLKNNADLMDENARLREALEAILDATRGHCPSISGIRLVAYTALKGEGNGA